MIPADQRRRRALRVYFTAGIVGAIVAVVLLVALRSLILPCVIGALLAYVFRPILRRMRTWGLPRGLAAVLLVGTVIFAIVLLVNQVRSAIPDDLGKLVLRVRIQYKLNERYDQLMGISEQEQKGNMLHELVGRELDPMVRQLNALVALDEEERRLFIAHAMGDTGVGTVSDKIYGYHLENMRRAEAWGRTSVKGGAAQTKASSVATDGASLFASVLGVLSLWLVTPFVFMFLLLDDGSIKRWLVRFVPNRYFEMTLTGIDNVDRAIGRYLRGTVLECSLVGLTIFCGLFLIGVDLEWAMIIGILAGVANAIPFLGPVIGLVIGLGYALIVEEVNPILPFVTVDNLVIGVVLTVAVAQLLDNAVFQPVVLGGVVNLHPLVVVIGVMGGSIMFGFAGMLFAIPSIVIVRVVVETLFTQLKAYRMI